MHVDVYDTHARTADGEMLHFDVLVPSGQGNRARTAALDWLRSRGIDSAEIGLSRCSFCHSETTAPDVTRRLEDDGYVVIPLAGFPEATQTINLEIAP